MRVEVSGNRIAVTPELREYAQRRVHFTLRRFANRVEQVRIRLIDVNGPRGGIDTHCRITVWGKRIDGLTSAALAVNPETAISEAMVRMRRVVKCGIERVKERQRRSDLHRPPLP